MTCYKISKPNKSLKGTISLTASKSESNRALMIQALCEENFNIQNLAQAQDTQTLNRVLKEIHQNNNPQALFDVGPAGTTMRFLTAYLSTQPGTWTLTGSKRMKERPIKILVNALRELGADIEYIEKEGFAPLKIKGGILKGGEVSVDGHVSSQYISALLLISPMLINGLVIKLKGNITSRPYINMTLKMMEHFNVVGIWQNNMGVNSISVSKQKYSPPEQNYCYTIEADWSSASYWYGMAAMADEVSLTILGLKKESLQGDSLISNLFNFFGINTHFEPKGILITKSPVITEFFGFDFSDCPDIAQTVAVVVSALKIPSILTGLHTLKIKETNRINALKTELAKTGITTTIYKEDTIEIIPEELNEPISGIETYEDHRMAMAFVPLAFKLKEITIQNPQVVGKSYPSFWEDLKSLDFIVSLEEKSSN